MEKSTKKLVIAALMTAFTCIATMIIKIPTPTLGYIHLGDSMTLLSGIILGPVSGGFAAGIGSMLADLFSGYATWAPATFVIKALSSAITGFLFHQLKKIPQSPLYNSIRVITGGLFGEVIMVTGYFLYETGLAAFASGGFHAASIASGAAASALSIPFNIAQGILGIILSLLLLPILLKISDIREFILD